jgi:hypothetical protein
VVRAIASEAFRSWKFSREKENFYSDPVLRGAAAAALMMMECLSFLLLLFSLEVIDYFYYYEMLLMCAALEKGAFVAMRMKL